MIMPASRSLCILGILILGSGALASVRAQEQGIYSPHDALLQEKTAPLATHLPRSVLEPLDRATHGTLKTPSAVAAVSALDAVSEGVLLRSLLEPDEFELLTGELNIKEQASALPTRGWILDVARHGILQISEEKAEKVP